MLTPKMKRIADDIGGIILQDYDRDYLSLILANGLIIEDIIFQVLVECCRYAYLLKAEKHPLKYYIERDGLELDLARKEIKRTIDYTNEKFDLVEKEHKKNFEDTLLRPDFSKVKEKNRYPAYDFSEFQYWESCNIHDMGLIKAIIERRISSSKKVPVDRFVSLANEYDRAMESARSFFGQSSESTVFSSLQLFTLQTKYSFDYCYELAVKMEELGLREIPDMEYRLMAVAGSYNYNSILPIICPEMATFADTRIEYPMIIQRQRFIVDIVTGVKNGPVDDILESINEANVLTNAIRSHSFMDKKPLPLAIAEETNIDDWASVFEIYNVFRTFVPQKVWTDARIKSVRKMYDLVSLDYKTLKRPEKRP